MGSPLTSSSQSKEILCIEEHGDICILLRKMLDGNEYKVAHARDTRQAGDYLRTTQPVMVLIENSFFADTGIEYAASLKAMLPQTKVIMLSAQDGQKKEAARTAGIDIFLTKPFTKTQLLDAVVSLLARSERQ